MSPAISAHRPLDLGGELVDRGLGLRARQLVARVGRLLERLDGRPISASLRQALADSEWAMRQLRDDFSDAVWRQREQEREQERERAQRREAQRAVAAQQRYVGCADLPESWTHLGWCQPDGVPFALSRQGGQVLLAAGAIGSGKSQGLLALLDGALQPRPGLTSEALPPTAAVAFHYDLSGVSLPELLHAARPNPRAADRDTLERALRVQAAGLPLVRLVVPPAELDATWARLRGELTPEALRSIELRPLQLRLSDLGQVGLQALLGASPGRTPRYLEDVLEAAQSLGEELTLPALHLLLEVAPDLNAATRSMALARLGALERLCAPRADLWDLVQPGVLTIVGLMGRWLRRHEALPLIVAMMNACAQPSPRHGPMQRVLALDEVNRLTGDAAVWEHLVMTARQIRHVGSMLWLSGQDLLHVPDELLALATQFLCFRLRSPRVFAHLQQRVAGLGRVRFRRVSELAPGRLLWIPGESTDPGWRGRPREVYLRPPSCAHGGHTRAVL